MKTKKALIGLALLILTASGAAGKDHRERWGKELVVGQPNTPCPHVMYTTIGAAITAAKPGDTVSICPASYPEQLVITKSLRLRGIEVDGVNRVLLQPTLSTLTGLSTQAVITVMNTTEVTIENLAIDASLNSVVQCTPDLAGVHFLNASGIIEHSAITGASLATPANCATVNGNGFGVQVDSTETGSFAVTVSHNSIHDYGSKGVFVSTAGVFADVHDNTISSVGPSSGALQFGVYILNGAVADVHHNRISEGMCGSIPTLTCFAHRSEGVAVRSPGDGTRVRGNIIAEAQAGIFVNGANDLKILDNEISNIYGADGITIQGTASGSFTNSIVRGNRIYGMEGITDPNAGACGIYEYSNTGLFSGNDFSDNTVNDAYCGASLNLPDSVTSGVYFNVLYQVLNSANPAPQPVEP